MEFRSLEGQEMCTSDKIVPLKDLNNFDSDPEEFARTLCKDLDIRDAEVAVIRTLKECSSYLPEYPELALDALSRIYIFVDFKMTSGSCSCKLENNFMSLRRYNFQIAFQSVASARETRISKKGRRGAEHVSSSKGSGIALDLVKLFGGKSSVIRWKIKKRKEWDLYEPIVDLLSNEEVETLDAREERNAWKIRDGIATEFLNSVAIPSLIFQEYASITNGIKDGNKNSVSDSVSD
ncbi:hypothetical protein Syun_029642 [Stephania yunnanensis]|uniref:Uncharacterized protein n=1 Tax=Stephania yunnanensis TaxID=152371 RepID=A0AAP0EDK3_9MAGN